MAISRGGKIRNGSYDHKSYGRPQFGVGGGNRILTNDNTKWGEWKRGHKYSLRIQDVSQRKNGQVHVQVKPHKGNGGRVIEKKGFVEFLDGEPHITVNWQGKRLTIAEILAIGTHYGNKAAHSSE